MSVNIITPRLQFVPVDHVYALDGATLIGVTRLLDMAGLIQEKAHWTPDYCVRGQLVHTAIQYDAQGELDEATIDPRIEGRVRGWRRFRRDARILARDCELAMADAILGIAGTADMIAATAFGLVLIDFKSGAPAPWHAAQLVGYRHLLATNAKYLGLSLRGVLAMEMWDVYLSDDDYRLVPIVGANLSRGKKDWLSAIATRALIPVEVG